MVPPACLGWANGGIDASRSYRRLDRSRNTSGAKSAKPSSHLAFGDDAFMPVRVGFDSILDDPPLRRQDANDLEAAPRFGQMGAEGDPYGLARLELVLRHGWPF